MKLDLANLKKSPGVNLPIDWISEFDHIHYRGRSLRLSSEVSLLGSAFYQDGIVQIEFALETEVEGECSRCLTNIMLPIVLHDSIEFIEEPKEGLDVVLVNEFSFEYGLDELDLMPYLDRIIEASIETKPLCKPDCKGLCAECGQDLNKAQCECHLKQEVDPRLEKLKELLSP